MSKIRIVGNKEFLNSEHFEKIKAIKTFRTIWGLSLKGAKDTVDAIQSTGVLIRNWRFPSTDALKELEYFNIQIRSEAGSLYTRLKQLLVASVKANEFELAEDLLAVYKKHYCQ